jgi:hypothetical protein
MDKRYDVGGRIWHEMFWRDNEHLLYETPRSDDILINPFTGELAHMKPLLFPTGRLHNIRLIGHVLFLTRNPYVEKYGR